MRPRDKVEDEDVGLVPLDRAIALSESDVCSRGESGVGIRLRSAWGCEAAVEAAEGTVISAGGAARVRLSVCACVVELSNRAPEFRGLELDVGCTWTGLFSTLAPEFNLGLELRPGCDVRGLDSGPGISAACCMDGSVLLLDAEETRGLLGKVIECGLLLRSVWERAAGLTSGSATGTGSVALRVLLPVRRRRCLPSSLD